MSGRWAAAAFVFVLCFSLLLSFSSSAAERGRVHHVDTPDYCLRAGDVTVGMSELQGLNESQKQALVESASSYAFYLWEEVYRAWGDPVSGSGDFSSVSWDREGTYEIRVAMPALTEDIVSEISYTLKIVDDLPEEPEHPMLYRITVRYLEEETGDPLKEDSVIDDLEEGAAFEIGEEVLLPPEGYVLAEIRGELEGEIFSDREILVICRLGETEPREPEEPGDGDDPDPEDPEEGQTGGGPGDQNGENKSSGNPTGKTGGNKGSGTGKNSGKKNSVSGNKKKAGEKGNGSASSGNRSSAGRETKESFHEAQAAESGEPGERPAEEHPEEQAAPVQESVPASGEAVPSPAEAEIPDDADTADVAALSPGNDQYSDQASIGGAVIAQTQEQKERYPLWSLTLGIAESSILVVLVSMIFSDLKLIRWFERKKRG